MIYRIPTDPVPNQMMSTVLDGTTWYITLETRLDNLYISLKTDGQYKVLNRICQDSNHLGEGFYLVDIDGNTDPVYSGLGTRYVLVWAQK